MFNRHFFEFEHRSRLFEKGDLKYIILDLLKDKPSHGYEIIRAMEEGFHGFYTPSAGSVYPTLQLLEDIGYVSSSERDGKKVYTVTDEGEKFLGEREEVINKIKSHMKDWCGPHGHEDFHETLHEFRNIGHLFRQRMHHLDAEKWARIKEVISRAHRDIEAILEK